MSTPKLRDIFAGKGLFQMRLQRLGGAMALRGQYNTSKQKGRPLIGRPELWFCLAARPAVHKAPARIWGKAQSHGSGRKPLKSLHRSDLPVGTRPTVAS